MPALSLPKTAPTIVDRPRFAEWLNFSAATPLRLIAAPAGAGKTTSAVIYARTRAVGCAYVKLAPGTPVTALFTQLGRATGNPAIRSYDALLDHFAHLARIEIIVDNVDDASDEARELLGRIFADVSESVTFIYLARSVASIDVRAAAAAGLADVCNDGVLAFDEDEVAALARSAGRTIERTASRALLDATHGWAIAIAGACRAAAAHQLGFDEALVYWRRSNDAAIRNLVSDTLRTVPQQLRRTFAESLGGSLPPDPEALAMLRDYGLFVAPYAGRLAINPLVRPEPGEAVQLAGDDVPPAAIEMFGRFSMLIDGREVIWERRRDRQIIQFLAMQPNGRATRAELIAAFWPDGDPHLARQSLRTAFCTIRQAIGACVGTTNVGHYFVADHVVELKLSRTTVSARRFAELFERGQSADTENDLASALGCYREAELLYRSGFLAGEPPMPWAAPHGARLARMYDRISQRLGGRGLELGAAGVGSRAPRDVA